MYLAVDGPRLVPASVEAPLWMRARLRPEANVGAAEPTVARTAAASVLSVVAGRMATVPSEHGVGEEVEAMAVTI